MKFWKGPDLKSVEGYAMCFACGQENPVGLKLRFRRDGDTVKAEFTPEECHQGWPGIVHGGIIETLLDEAMCYAPFFHGMYCVTAKIEVRIRQPVPAGQRLLISSNLVRKRRKLVETEANIVLEDGTPVAEGKAIMYVINQSKKGRHAADAGSTETGCGAEGAGGRDHLPPGTAGAKDHDHEDDLDG